MRRRDEIIEFLSRGAYRPLSFKELTRTLNIPKAKRNAFKRLVKDLVAQGELIKIRGGRYGLPSKMNLVKGELICHPDGYGFVRPHEGGDDIFVPPNRLGGAMHGDNVVVRIEGIKKGGRKEGSIIRVITRAHRSVVGRFERHRGFGVVIPSDERIIENVIIPPGDDRGAEHGKIVVAEITRWPTKHLAPAGRVTEILGDPEDPDVEIEVIVRKYGLPHRFPRSVLKEVKSIPKKVLPEEMEGRVDLRDKRVFTIDGETAKDFDDAVSIERTRRGFRLFVSIADVSHYVKEGTALDKEAFSRGTSVYFPDRCVPMLPEPLSNGICSLNPDETRLTLTAELEFDRSGRPLKKRFYESVIKSTERLTYTKVKTLLSGEDPKLEKRYSHILEDLRLMEELALKLNQRRMEEGSIDFDLPEPRIIIDIEGRVEDIVRSERNIAHRMIEEFMLAANRAVAEVFSSRGWPFLYRVHEEPDAGSIKDFLDFVAGFGVHVKKGDKGLKPGDLQKILAYFEGRPEERLINHVLLRAMKQARYSAENIGHFGLAFRDYTHFTSPIRRYPDLVVHRMVRMWLKRRYTARVRERMAEVLPAIAEQSSARERVAMEAEREIADLKKAQFMMDKVGEEFDGFVSGVTSFGLFVELKDYFVEGLVHVSTLRDDYYIYDEKRHTLYGEHTARSFRPGDSVRVMVERVDLERRRVDMVLVEKNKRPSKKRRRKRC